MCVTAGRACIVGNLWGDKASAEGGRIYLRCMIQRLCLVLMVLGMGTLSYAQASDNVEDAAAFLKEMGARHRTSGQEKSGFDAISVLKRTRWEKKASRIHPDGSLFGDQPHQVQHRDFGYFQREVVLSTKLENLGGLACPTRPFQAIPRKGKACESYLSLSGSSRGMLSSSAATWLVRQGDLVCALMRLASL